MVPAKVDRGEVSRRTGVPSVIADDLIDAFEDAAHIAMNKKIKDKKG